jgi:hypothetical protein
MGTIIEYEIVRNELQLFAEQSKKVADDYRIDEKIVSPNTEILLNFHYANEQRFLKIIEAQLTIIQTLETALKTANHSIPFDMIAKEAKYLNN